MFASPLTNPVSTVTRRDTHRPLRFREEETFETLALLLLRATKSRLHHQRRRRRALVVAAPASSTPSLLLIRRDRPPFAGAWALPAGFVDEGETLDAAAARELAEETGLLEADDDDGQAAAPPLVLRQYDKYGDPGRDPRGWCVTVAYAAMLRGRTAPEIKAGDDAREARWWPRGSEEEEVPPLAFDHARVVSDGLRALAGREAVQEMEGEGEGEGEAGGRGGGSRAVLLRAADLYARAPAPAAEEEKEKDKEEA